MEQQPKTVTNKEAPEPTFFNFKKVLIVMAVVVVAILVPMGIQSFIASRLSTDSPVNADSKAFEILSSPPTSATVGEEYKYLMRIGQYDSFKVYVEATTLPGWLSWDNENFVLTGTPSEKYLGQNFVVLKATDTKTSKEQPFTIYVDAAKPTDDGDVNGVSTVDNSYYLGEDNQNEPQATSLCQQYYRDLGALGLLNKHPECKGIFASGNNSSNQNNSGNGGSVQGVSDFAGGAAISSLGSLEASSVSSGLNLLGINIDTGVQKGLIAALAVVIVGAALLLTWIILNTIVVNIRGKRGEYGEVMTKNFDRIKLSNKKQPVQETLISDDSEKENNIIIWD